MVVLVLERVPAGVRGLLTRWLLEVQAGVFVGRVSSRVRDELWAKVVGARRSGACVMIHPAKTELGLAFRSEGDPSRIVVDFEGLPLLRLRDRPTDP